MRETTSRDRTTFAAGDLTSISSTPAIWPRDDPREIAIAARVVMLAAASRTLPITGLSDEQATLLTFIQCSTREEGVNGRSFPEFLNSSKNGLVNLVNAVPGACATVTDTITDVLATDPADPISQMFDDLRRLTGEAYGTPLDVPLERIVARDRSCPFQVSAHVPASRTKVMLKLYTGLDFVAFALLPFVLTHELVCHAAARHTGWYGDGDDITARELFTEGFMDRAAHFLLAKWIDTEEAQCLEAAAHISVSQQRYYTFHRQSEVYEAGEAAWTTCRAAIGARLRGGSTSPGLDALEHTLFAALILNTSTEDIKSKDRFVYLARQRSAEVAAAYTKIAIDAMGTEVLFHLTGDSSAAVMSADA